ncbi:MAG: hypothetical protein PS018_17230 [bacterium]|nr:hypothetical protein [bacterium]
MRPEIVLLIVASLFAAAFVLAIVGMVAEAVIARALRSLKNLPLTGRVSRFFPANPMET